MQISYWFTGKARRIGRTTAARRHEWQAGRQELDGRRWKAASVMLLRRHRAGPQMMRRKRINAID